MDINEILFLGNNKYGQAGIGEKYHNKSFTQPKSFAFEVFVKQISCGAHHSAILTIDGLVYTMGSNIHGALGTSPSINYSFTPSLVEGITEVSQIECGSFHMCAIEKGALYTWGKGIDGQLGHGNTKNVSKPTLVEGIDGQVEAMSCGTNHTIVSIRKQGQRQCFAFGNGIYGQLGTGQNRNSYIPVKVKLEKVQNFAAGQNHSLFIIQGQVYACGDNSNGQLGTLFNKKFLSEPIKVIFEGQNEFVRVQAKKYSLALTQKGDMYIWGLKAGFGTPKKIRGQKNPNIVVVDVRLGSDKIYGLTSNGSLYEWDIMKGAQNDGIWICNNEKIIPNTRPIVDFSSGDGYLLMLGDIVKQIQSREIGSHQLSIIEDIDSFSTSMRFENMSNSEDTNFVAESRVSHDQNSKDYNFEKIKPQSHKPRNTFFEQSPFAPKKRQDDNLEYDNPLREKKDFNNLVHLKKEEINEKPKKFIQRPLDDPEPPIEPLEREYISHDTLDFIKSQSSVIQCEPSNFLKQSEKRQNNVQHNCQVITDSFLSEEHQVEQEAPKHSFSQIQQNLLTANFEKKRKHKKIDRLMQLLQKSHHISEKSNVESSLKQQDLDLSQLKQSEVIKSNRLLRAELRQKQMKIGQLQELLSRKEMEIEAQREVIKILRQKNNSNYASVEHH